MHINQSKIPLWKKSMLRNLNFWSIMESLYEIENDGDPYGYENEAECEGYYYEYKDQFDELSGGAYALEDAMRQSCGLDEIWDEVTVGLFGYQETVLGYDAVETDYYGMLNFEEDAAVREAEKRLMRLTKEQLINNFRRVMTALLLFFDVKASHDCLVSIVQELDERGAVMKRENEYIDKLYEDLTGAKAENFEQVIRNIPQRMWVE